MTQGTAKGILPSPRFALAVGLLGVVALVATWLAWPSIPTAAAVLVAAAPLLIWAALSMAGWQALARLERGRADEIAAGNALLSKATASQADATREIHHRVKNNVQVIASVVNLHARSAETPDAIAAYASIQRRIEAMAVVHRNHYAEPVAGDGIDLRTLLNEVAANLAASFGQHAPAILLDVAHARLPLERAVSIAFLVTELVELSASTDREAPIAVGIGTEDGQARLSIASTALAHKAAIEDAMSKRYGRVVEGLARQLRAPLARTPEGFAVTFQLSTK